MSDMVVLTNTERAVGQILMTFGIVKDSELQSYVGRLRDDFTDDDELSLTDMFKRMNQLLKVMGLQIRSLMLQEYVGGDDEEDDDGENEAPGDRYIRVTYHGIINLEQDSIAEKFGCNLKPEELLFFKDCVDSLVRNKFQSLHDLVHLSDLAKNCRSGWKGDMELLIGRLIDNKWLQRTDRSYIELGPRAHLELRTLIESVALAAAENLDEGRQEDLRQELLGQLPQIIFH